MRSAVATASRNRFQRRRAQARRALLEAARRALASKGYHGARIADIAREADVGVGTFCRYYKTKEALFIELVAARLLKRRLAVLTRPVDRPARVRSRQHRDLLPAVKSPADPIGFETGSVDQ